MTAQPEGGFEPLTLDHARAWIATARPGASIVYGRGVIASEAARPEVAAWLYAQASKGFVSLVQRRVTVNGRQVFEYIAQRIAKRLDPAEPLSPGREFPARPGPPAHGKTRHVALQRQRAEDAWQSQFERAFA